ncbi:phosphonate ABC transporter, permease protein PhnE [Rudaeicoccus suwonensis]|uniref:Phosphonate transport system permease protein n=1 Tax=Rudaeicoccus suwonensis TaxID=657409 RepID=A0A561EA44_9MICO|nr:phosphonate ABC transporter, permease protein PhnE [Rudaeicoccus suwonensis]TWE12494.1 phosphonate transport system permease protein [Rudaeicoccus suwonensis]
MSAPSLAPGAATATRPAKPGRLPIKLGWALLVVIVLICFWRVNVDWSELSDFFPSLFHYIHLMFGPPAWSQTSAAFSATVLSVQMAWIGAILGVLVSFPLSFLAAANVVPVWVRLPVRLILAVFRAVPEVVIAILILSVTGLTAWTGALALGIGSIGTLGKWGYESFESVAPGPMEAARSTGGSRFAIVRWGLWPQAQSEVLAFWLYRFEISVRSSAILGLIGAGGIGKMLSDNIQYQNWNVVGMLLIVVVIVTMIIDQISGTLRQRLITGRWAWVGYGKRRRSLTPKSV